MFGGFSGCLHCNELVKLKCSDITFNTESMLINEQSSKTDQYWEGASLVYWVSNMPRVYDGEVFPYGKVRSFIPRFGV